MGVLQIKEDQFEAEVEKAEGKVLVDFWASWCGPCKMLSPVVEQLSGEVQDVKFVGLDVDDSERLAMKYGTPYLAAQLYAGGEGGEVYFSYPGVTNNSCPRCALSSRYEAYEAGFQNDVTSDSSDYFSSLRMNSIEGKIALMLLMYHEDDRSRYNKMLDKVADRNFVQIRMSPFVGEHLGLHVFDRAMAHNYSFFDESVWIPQVPNNEANGYKKCPLCGGTGDLLALKGTIADTREV